MDKIKITEDALPKRTIQPYKLTSMMKTASQITDKLTNIPAFIVTYDDIEFILEIVMMAVKRAKKENNGGY